MYFYCGVKWIETQSCMESNNWITVYIKRYVSLCKICKMSFKCIFALKGILRGLFDDLLDNV